VSLVEKLRERGFGDDDEAVIRVGTMSVSENGRKSQKIWFGS
jgi:hypothetical protein